jgi:hypothetical protein
LHESPTEALGEAGDLVAQMMEARGFPLEEREGESLAEPETVREFIEARRIARLVESGEPFDPGDVALAVESIQSLYTYLLEYGPTPGVP